MTDLPDVIFTLLPVLMFGMVLGMAFFLILWLTVRRGLLSRHPASWFVGGVLLRMGLALGGFYFVAKSGWLPLVICLLGFVIAREWVQRRVVFKQTTRPNTLN
ncbi:MAG: F1F0 ATPase subunit 2 [Paraglaciecola sp.]|jgi:F1F0 ATPase subunit 2